MGYPQPESGADAVEGGEAVTIEHYIIFAVSGFLGAIVGNLIGQWITSRRGKP